MQQTKAYKLNLIETGDTFSPDPLNENMEKLEAALSALGGSDTSLDSRISALEGRRLVTGVYAGTGEDTTQTIPLGFDPILVYVRCNGMTAVDGALAFPGHPYKNTTLKIESGSFSVGDFHNASNQTYHYIAIL